VEVSLGSHVSCKGPRVQRRSAQPIGTGTEEFAEVESLRTWSCRRILSEMGLPDGGKVKTTGFKPRHT
jgi:hypothetical protein